MVRIASSRFLLLAAALLAFPSDADAQTVPSAQQPVPITGVVRHAGTLHLATNTWTRGASQAPLGADTIYDNTCTGTYFEPLRGNRFVDEGRLPSPTGPSNLNARPGCATSYRVDGFQIGYCTDQVGPAGFQVNFFGQHYYCQQTGGYTPDGSIALAGLPGSASGATACWTVTLDLGPPPGGTALSFVMAADADGTWQHDYQNFFAWSMRSTSPGSQSGTGPIIAGDWSLCQGFDGTRWDPVVNYGEQGTGMGTIDGYRIEAGPTPTVCTSFGGLYLASFHLEIYAEACPTLQAGTEFCLGDGSGAMCPCNNQSFPGEHGGCMNWLSHSGRLRAEGQASLANDTVRLFSAGMAPGGPQLFFQGTTRVNNGLGQAFGDGLLCVGGTIVRLGLVSADAAGAAELPTGGGQSLSIRGGVTSPGVRMYQSWYRGAADYCTPATFNMTNGWEVNWAP